MGQTESTVEEVATPHQKLHKIVQSELTHITKFDATQLQALYASFLAENPDGNIQRKQFIAQNRELTNFGDDEFWGHIFDLFDEDQNDEISFAEWVVLLSLLKKGSAKEKVKWLFEVLDRDKSGYLSRNDLEFIFRLIFVFYPDAYSDRTPKDFANRVFEKLECQQDDKLSLKKFMEAVKKFPLLLDSLLILSEVITGEVAFLDEKAEGGAVDSQNPHVKLRFNRFQPVTPKPAGETDPFVLRDSSSTPSERSANGSSSSSSSSARSPRDSAPPMFFVRRLSQSLPPVPGEEGSMIA